jgi:hypothetical protein
LRRFVAGAIGTVSRGKKLQQGMRLLERYELRLAGGANQLLASERRVAYEHL